MENELILKSDNVVALIQNNGIDNLIKPLNREVLLFDTYIAGTMHIDDENALDEVRKGDKLTLRRENNRFDENAILVLDEKGRKLGYVPEKDNTVFARLMDAGKLLTSKVNSIGPRNSFRNINIDIYLVDF